MRRGRFGRSGGIRGGGESELWGDAVRFALVYSMCIAVNWERYYICCRQLSSLVRLGDFIRL